jgi:hypothetical protein
MAVVLETDAMLKAKGKELGLNQAEVILGLQELVGRIIVDMAMTTVGADELVGHAKKHLEDTVRIGMEVRGKSALAS